MQLVDKYQYSYNKMRRIYPLHIHLQDNATNVTFSFKSYRLNVVCFQSLGKSKISSRIKT